MERLYFLNLNYEIADISPDTLGSSWLSHKCRETEDWKME